jgi:hypothetical protein
MERRSMKKLMIFTVLSVLSLQGMEQKAPLTVAVLNGTSKKLLMIFTRNSCVSTENIKPWQSAKINVAKLQGNFGLEILDEARDHYKLKNMMKKENPEWNDSFLVREDEWKQWVENKFVRIQLFAVTKEVGQENDNERRLLVSLSQ